MRGTLLVASLLMGLAASGCFGAEVRISPDPSDRPSASDSPPLPANEFPYASFTVRNHTGNETIRHYVAEDIRLDARASSDPDGTIANYTWRFLRYGLPDTTTQERYGAQTTLRFEHPGDRVILLTVRDERGAETSDYQSIGVNQHRIESGKLVLGQLPLAAGPLGERNYSLPVVDGALALSISATFPKDPANKIRLEIRAPNGTLLNRTDALEGPAWSIAAPKPGVVGNYTAHIGLVSGVATEFRLEFIAWYGYS